LFNSVWSAIGLHFFGHHLAPSGRELKGVSMPWPFKLYQGLFVKSNCT
jgi:hypothetical protein